VPRGGWSGSEQQQRSPGELLGQLGAGGSGWSRWAACCAFERSLSGCSEPVPSLPLPGAVSTEGAGLVTARAGSLLAALVQCPVPKSCRGEGLGRSGAEPRLRSALGRRLVSGAQPADVLFLSSQETAKK